MAEYDPNYVPERDVWQQWSDRLGSLGMTLIGAGQKITPQQRAQIFSEGAKYMQTNNAGMLNAAQARLYNQQAKDKFDDKQRAERAREMLRAMGLGGSDAVLADLSPEEYAKAKFNVANRQPTQYEFYNRLLDQNGIKGPDKLQYFFPEVTQNNRMQEYFYGPGGVQSSPLPDLPDATATPSVAPAAMPRPMSPGAQAGTMIGGGGQPQPAPVQPAQPTQPTQPTQPKRMSTVPEDVSPSRAFGFGPFVTDKAVVPWQASVSNELKGDAKAFDRASSYINRLNQDIAGALAVDTNGRPTNYTLKLQNDPKFQPKAGGFGMSPDMAASRYEDALYELKQAHAEHEAEAQRLAAAKDYRGAMKLKSQAANIANTYRRVFDFTLKLKQEIGQVSDGFEGTYGGTIIAPNGAKITPMGGQ